MSVKLGLLLATVAISNLAGQAPAAIGAPNGLTAQVFRNTVTLRWIAASGEPTTYFIEAGTASGSTDLANFATGSLATTFTAAFVPNGTYYVRVRAGNAAETSTASNEVTVVVAWPPCFPPAAPFGLTATVNGTTVSLGWNHSQGATSYQLEAGSAPGLADLFIGDVGSGSTLTVAAVPGTYYVRVRAKAACGASAPSNEIIVIVLGTEGVTIAFSNLSGNRSAFVGTTEFGFSVMPNTGDWSVITTYGNPAPFIWFERPAGQNTTTADIRITAGGALFTFTAVDLYSSTTTIPYTFTGLLNSDTVFTSSGTVPNTFGRFATVTNPRRDVTMDTLLITLSNPGSACCSNPVGLDNIVVAGSAP